ncbi:MAG: DNA polymerase III subunit beta [Bacteroidetes bacterium GWE2_39_28]|nr:MAG: DNA polymerase III subunit beta [Bacteroidetes bacterium GWE2_39_28]OFY11594.1 MAG: DNA polymerase III subunit beta [Bacteroidetes bacterium GWF2_39_10]OFZ09088.1 MAG: DNA polymerase III subunit beta [Bacteroidetes bacterium RIFOXYB2_FULL_39_7]OFZ12221.1 MAG: DNA polymerase III subunit beta [Bacteroidetes bacterium RIFOXYC2_FULL_39_11]
MKFVVSSTELLARLLSVSRVISSKNTIPVLDNFLFVLRDGKLNITASDLETSLKASLPIENIEEEGEITIPARLLVDSLKEFADIPLEFSSNENQTSIDITWANGNSTLPCTGADDYPSIATISNDRTSITVNSQILLEGVNRTLYATAEEELRPVMNGIFFDIDTESATMVASDAHKLVCFTRHDIKSEQKSSFILPKKPSSILKNLLSKVEEDVKILFDQKNAYFEFESFILVCRLVEGNYPAYKSVIPKNNTNRLIINRQDFLNSTRRVSVCSNQASSLVKLKLSYNQLVISAQDLDFSISAHERLTCQYDGDPMEIGFKSTFLIEILSNLSYNDISLELSDPSRAALILPSGGNDPAEEILALIMPMMVSA